MKNFFEVGDKVKILHSPNYIDDMRKYEGRLATITKITIAGYHIDLDNGCYYWSYETLQLVTSEMNKTVDPCELKNGDYVKITNDLVNSISFIYLFKEMKDKKIYRHASYCLDDGTINLDPNTLWNITSMTKITYATEEEKKLLDKALLKQGYIWNKLTKHLENIGLINLSAQPVDFSSFRNSIQKTSDVITGTLNCTKEEPQTETELNLFPKKKHYQLNFNY